MSGDVSWLYGWGNRRGGKECWIDEYLANGSIVGGIVRFLQKGDCEVEPDAEEGAC